MRIEEKFVRQQAVFNQKFNSSNDDIKTQSNNEVFGDLLKKCINDVNNKVVNSDSITTGFIRGDDNVNIDDVMIKAQEANLSLQFLTLTRDKLLEGYETLSKMQL